jgi:hypothetical protein
MDITLLFQDSKIFMGSGGRSYSHGFADFPNSGRIAVFSDFFLNQLESLFMIWVKGIFFKHI